MLRVRHGVNWRGDDYSISWTRRFVSHDLRHLPRSKDVRVTEAMMKREDMIYRLEIKRSRLEIGVEIIKMVCKNMNTFRKKKLPPLNWNVYRLIYYSNWLFKISEFN